jgi:uncharacterized protein
VIKELAAVCPDVRYVRGNMDSEAESARAPLTLVIKLKKHSIGLVHGYGPPAKVPDIAFGTFVSNRVDAIVFGHTHQPYQKTRDGVFLFNPGSPTDTVYAPYQSYGILYVEDTLRAEIIKL